MAKVLIVDDEERMLGSFERAVVGMGHAVITAISAERAIELIDSSLPDVIISDLVMPGMGGLELLSHVKATHPSIPVIILTGQGTVKTAVQSIKNGAFDYITKPFDIDEIELAINRAIEHRDLISENIALKNQIERKYSFSNIIGESKPMIDIYRVIERIKDTKSNVLITGESGTGKELIAKAIHFNGFLKDSPFVTVDCASIAENLLESEMFGHVKGSFTGAHRDRTGYFEEADGGTIFLDEIAEFSIHLQTKLLRVIQEGEFSRVGESKVRKVNVRIIAATNRDLEAAVKSGSFREDLYYRLNVIRIKMPSLRERIEDIPQLARHFTLKYSEKIDKNITGISDEVITIFSRHAWPGNVRELENIVERAVIFCDSSSILPHHLPDGMTSDSQNPCFATEHSFKNMSYKDAKNAIVKNFNREYIVNLIKNCGGNISEASRKSGIDRGGLYRLIRKYELDDDLRN
ncbi:MAG TPA: sigma-54 dependent transcriptional regulator [bacterium]|nr:sigma-54 dependent transcriptional regulator [bacterium]